MPLNKDVLGIALKEKFDEFNNKNPANLGDIEVARLNFCKAMAEEIINHFKANAVIHVNTTGTAAAQSGLGTIQS